MKNPLDRILAKGLQAMLKTIEEELSKLVNQLLQDAVSPHMLADLLKKVGGIPMDWSALAGMVGQQPGFDPYQILGLDKSASDEEVKKRFKDLIKKIHPDVAGVSGTDFLTRLILAAYELIRKERGF